VPNEPEGPADQSQSVLTGVKPPCFPGSKEARCLSKSLEENEEGGDLSPDSAAGTSAESARGDGDFHSKDADSRYHAFHQFLYEPLKPRRRNYGKRDVSSVLQLEDSAPLANASPASLPSTLLVTLAALSVLILGYHLTRRRQTVQ